MVIVVTWKAVNPGTSIYELLFFCLNLALPGFPGHHLILLQVYNDRAIQGFTSYNIFMMSFTGSLTELSESNKQWSASSLLFSSTL